MRRVLLVILMLWCMDAAVDGAAAQTVTSDKIRPGKEKIVLEFPKEQRWRRQRIPKDVSSIRGWSYAPTRGDTALLAVRNLETSTIDRRYFPVRARRTMSDKITFAQREDPGVRVEILHEQVDVEENRTSVIYALFPGDGGGAATRSAAAAAAENDGGTGSDGASVVTLMLAAEGPTAFHTVEIPIPARRASREVLMEWVAILRASQIQ